MKKSNRWIFWLALLVSLAVYFLLAYDTARVDATRVVGLYSLLFVLYFIILGTRDKLADGKILISYAVLVRILLLFAIPFLSDDFYRFIWDGKILAGGENPFLHTPRWYQSDGLNPADSENFSLLNSKDYYSVYPPLLQYVFLAAVKIFPDNFEAAVITVKSSVLLAEVGSIFLLVKLGRKFGLGEKAAAIYMLNPLVIIELSGNLHFDSFLIFFLLAAIWFASKGNTSRAGIFAGLAVAAKINPLMVFPFFIRRFGWKKLLVFCALAGITFLATVLPLYEANIIPRFAGSLRLYFQSFEFNGSIYYLGKYIFGQNFSPTLGKILPLIAGLAILAFAFKDKRKDWKSLPEMILFAFTLYLLFARVIHPWYLTTLVAFGSLTRYRYAILWSALIPLTYLTYASELFIENTVVIWVEYILVFAFIGVEWLTKGYNRTLEDILWEKPFFKKLYARSIPKRVAIKFDRIVQHLKSGDRVLDIGTGNGGLCHSIVQAGYEVESIDIRDRSFFKDAKPIVYDGSIIPFGNDEFNTALIITVLHHTPDPKAIIEEALRVAPRVVIMEDIYKNPIQKHLTYFTDSLVNLEFADHPHTNKDDAGWRQLFDELNVKMVFREDFRTLLFFRQVIYVIER